MAVSNSLAEKKETFSVYLGKNSVKEFINNQLGSERGLRFMAALVSAVSANPGLQECEHSTILSAALLGETLGLSPSPQLGQYYIVPFNDRKNNRKVAQFQIGYKGYLSMAFNTGRYSDLDVIEIREGEYLGRDEFTGKPKFKFVQDDVVRETLPIIGYLAYLELDGRFKKTLYWSKAKMEKHADTYSTAFNLAVYKDMQEGKIPATDLWKYSSFWYKSFDSMAFKTMLRQLLGKWGALSTEMRTAMEKDMGVVTAKGKDNFEVSYVDNAEEGVDADIPSAPLDGEVVDAEIVPLEGQQVDNLFGEKAGNKKK